MYGIPIDKTLHFLVGAFLYAISVAAVGVPYALLLVLAAGGIKEVLDEISRRRSLRKGEVPIHSVDSLDMLSTVAGSVAVYLISSAFMVVALWLRGATA